MLFFLVAQLFNEHQTIGDISTEQVDLTMPR